MNYQDHFKKARKAAAATPRQKSLSEEEVEAQLRKAFGLKADRNPAENNQKKIKVKKRKKAEFPLYPAVSLVAMFIGLSSYFIFPTFFNDILSHVEISYMSSARAKSEPEGKKAPSSKQGQEAKASSDESHGDPSTSGKNEESVKEEASYLDKLRERKAALDLREAELNQLEEELQRQKQEVEQRIVELTKIREEIASKLEDRVEADQGKVKKLVELYSSMKPKQAAKIVEGINRELAVEVLAGMKKKSAADIMNVMDEKVAKELSERLTGYKRSTASVKKD